MHENEKQSICVTHFSFFFFAAILCLKYWRV